MSSWKYCENCVTSYRVLLSIMLVGVILWATMPVEGVEPPCAGTVSGLVSNDENCDSIGDGGAAGIPGVRVSLRGTPPSDLLVSSFNTDSVLRYDGQTGAFITTFASNGGLNGPDGLTFGPDGNLYVSSYLGNSVLRYDGETGLFIDVFAFDGGMNGPEGLDFGPDGNLYVSNSGTDSILRYDGVTGIFIDIFASEGGLDNPVGFDFDFGPDGNLYVSSYGTDSILRYDGVTGAFIDTFASGSGLTAPTGLGFGPDDNLYVSSSGTDSVLRYDGQTGAFIDTFASNGLSVPHGLLFGPDDNLYVSSFGSNMVLRYDGQTGVLMDTFASDGGLSGPAFLTFMPAPSEETLLAETLTQADGFYSFVDLCAGDYTVEVDEATLPPDLSISFDPEGDVDGRAAVSLGPDENSEGIDFGYVALGSIGDRIWLDNGPTTACDGVPDDGEPGIAGIDILLKDDTGTIVQTTSTDADGLYSFSDLCAGDYTIEVDEATVPPNLSISFDPQGDVDGQAGVSLGPGEDRDDVDFAYCEEEPGGECSPCEEGVTQLTLRYTGEKQAKVKVLAWKRVRFWRWWFWIPVSLFKGQVQPDETFTFDGYRKDGTMARNVLVMVNCRWNAEFHTDCSKAIGPGLVSGDFEVVEGFSSEGGPLCPIP